MEATIEVAGLRKRFGATQALDGMTFTVLPGQVTGFVGPNGAGKSTTMRVILGLDAADEGTALISGQPYAALRHPLSQVGALLDAGALQPGRKARNHLLWLAHSQGLSARRVDEVVTQVGLASAARRKAGGYSLGMRQRLGVAACLIGDPELLILDEPMNGLDPAGMHEMRDMIDSLVAEGRTVMLSSHLLDEVQRTCQAVAIVDRGRVIRQGPIQDLLRSANAVVRVECADPDGAASLLAPSDFVEKTDARSGVLSVTLRVGSTRDTVAELNRRLVAGGVAVYGLQEVQTSLEDWFLSVTSRLGEPE